MSVFLAALIAFFSLFIPGVLIAFALLKNTELHTFEKAVLGFVLGIIFVPTLTWAESYFMDYIHFFSFSLALVEVNSLVLTIFGIILCYQQNIFKDFKGFLVKYGIIAGKLPEEAKEQVRDRLREFKEANQLIQEHMEKEHELEKKQWAALEESASSDTAAYKSLKARQELEMNDLINAHYLEESAKLSELSKGRKGILHSSWLPWAVLLLLMLLSFYTRIVNISVAPKFFEFDPYFDMIDTQYILTYGYQLLYDHSAWPVVATGTNHRVEPIIPYLEAYWYKIVDSLGPHYTNLNNALISDVSSVYPPLVGAFLVFIIFMLLYHEYDSRIALIGAALATSMPTLITTFIAGEQLLEPWGIFALFFFFATYMLAIKHQKNKRLAVLAGIAYSSNFLGAHYFTVTAGVLALYILLEGIIDTFRKEITIDFYKMNGIVLAVIAFFLALYQPYGATMTNRTPEILGIPIMLSFPLIALVLVAVFEYMPKYLSKHHLLFKDASARSYAEWFLAILAIILILVFATPFGKPFKNYIELSKKFTTPSSPLFMTVAEYEPTGLTFNFASNGFGAVGGSVFGFPLILWLVLFASIILIFVSIFFRKSKTGILYLAISLISIAGFSEVKYLPHFGVVYILLFSIMLGELSYLVLANFDLKELGKKSNYGLPSISSSRAMYIIFGIGILFVIFEFNSIFQVFEAASVYAEPNGCSIIMNNQTNVIGAQMFCNTVPQYWLAAAKWMRANVGPNGPRILSWWDYGDWINWFGNSYAVIRGDNAVAWEDYGVAANYVLGPQDNYTPATLSNYMNNNQTKYVLFDEALVQKWGALDFLACIHINATTMGFAEAHGGIGTSSCELSHDPEYVLVPLATMLPNLPQSASYYCNIPNKNTSISYARGWVIQGQSLSRQNICIELNPNSNGAMPVYSTNGTRLNAYVNIGMTNGAIIANITGTPTYYEDMLVIYTPNAANGSITDAPSKFYDSNFYRGFFLGNLPGFTLVYPANQTGINFVDVDVPLRIFAVNNFTGSLPPKIQKPSWITNNYTIPNV
ncbi:MAG: hypothetical protein ACP5RP_03725 [Candidatus Micrarchaeia archaeon]